MQQDSAAVRSLCVYPEMCLKNAKSHYYGLATSSVCSGSSLVCTRHYTAVYHAWYIYIEGNALIAFTHFVDYVLL